MGTSKDELIDEIEEYKYLLNYIKSKYVEVYDEAHSDYLNYLDELGE